MKHHHNHDSEYEKARQLNNVVLSREFDITSAVLTNSYQNLISSTLQSVLVHRFYVWDIIVPTTFFDPLWIIFRDKNIIYS